MQKVCAIFCSIWILSCITTNEYIYPCTASVFAEEIEAEELPIDFAYYQNINEDVYAWITVPGTNVDYPVLQHPEEDGFYLEHGLDKNPLFVGCIYSEKRNAKDFSDFNTVLYGHNMRNGSMFGTLHRFRDRQFFDEHREILIYTPEHTYHYTIFAAYKYDNRHILASWNFEQFPVVKKSVYKCVLTAISYKYATGHEILKEDLSSINTIDMPVTAETTLPEIISSETTSTGTISSETTSAEAIPSEATPTGIISSEMTSPDDLAYIDNPRLLRQIKVRRRYLQELYANTAEDAFILDDPIVTEDDKILTLATCINDPNYRFLVQGVLTNIE